MSDRCNCAPGRDHDGSEFGPCAYCERLSDEAAALKAMTWDALRWRFTQRPGFYVNRSYEFSEVESNVVAVFLGRTHVGYGRDLRGAVDCALYLTGEHGDDVPLPVALAFCRQHFGDRRVAGRWVEQPGPSFDLSEDGRVVLLGNTEPQMTPPDAELGPGRNPK